MARIGTEFDRAAHWSRAERRALLVLQTCKCCQYQCTVRVNSARVPGQCGVGMTVVGLAVGGIESCLTDPSRSHGRAQRRYREGVIHFTDDAWNTFAARGKWFEFYRLLILRDGAVVDRHALSQLKSWSSDGLANGRDVARHLQSQRVCRLQNSIVTSHAVTQEWRFSRGWAIQYDVAETSGTGAAIFKPDGAGYGSVALPDDADIADWAFPALEAYLSSAPAIFPVPTPLPRRLSI